jgi:xanthine dehydrogenase YagS FAD-binding subunit
MIDFTYEKTSDPDSAISALAENKDASFVAGGTELLNWMKEGIASPLHVVDINDLPFGKIEADSEGLHIGALARMSDVAADARIKARFPAISQAVELSASAQLRNMASMGGNLMQRTRCPYFRAEVDLPCNKRRPGSGCAARHGENRLHAIFGWSDQCVATHPSDVAVAFAALDASVRLMSVGGERSVPIVDFYRLPGTSPEKDNVLEHGELITGIHVPASSFAEKSYYLKLRERQSYEFALISVAAALDLDGSKIREARIALGGIAPKPWRLNWAENAICGMTVIDKIPIRQALDSAFVDARPLEHNGFKVELAKRAILRALDLAGGLS